jgi:hypothetical protein
VWSNEAQTLVSRGYVVSLLSQRKDAPADADDDAPTTSKKGGSVAQRAVTQRASTGTVRTVVCACMRVLVVFDVCV